MFVLKLECTLANSEKVHFGGAGAASKISTFPSQGPRFDPWLCMPRFEYLCDFLYHQKLYNGGVVAAVGKISEY